MITEFVNQNYLTPSPSGAGLHLQDQPGRLCGAVERHALRRRPRPLRPGLRVRLVRQRRRRRRERRSNWEERSSMLLQLMITVVKEHPEQSNSLISLQFSLKV